MSIQEHRSVNAGAESPDGAYLHNRIAFYLNGTKVERDLLPAMTTLDFLHRELGMFGTKCSCNEGDCGACTVVIVSRKGDRITYQAINSCNFPAAKLHGKHLITVEGLGTPQRLHPIQKAMLDFHGIQCGYCTPGFVMSIFAFLAEGGGKDRQSIMAALEGNLCRCTGYDSILQTVEYLADHYHASEIVPAWCRETEKVIAETKDRAQLILKHSGRSHPVKAYYVPYDLDELFLKMRDLEGETQYKIICGGTDLMVLSNVNKIHSPHLIDISQIQALQEISEHDDLIEIGAGVTYSQILHSDLINRGIPVLIRIIRQIASDQIRNSATLCGNICNASPVADGATTLLALDARLRIASQDAERYLPLSEYYLDYKKTALQSGEIIRAIIVPAQEPTDYATVFKSVKRRAVDISSIVTAARFRIADGHLVNSRLAVGGAAKYPKLSETFARFCSGRILDEGWFAEAAEAAVQDFIPISDVRGSDAFRRRMIRNHALLCLQECLERVTGGER